MKVIRLNRRFKQYKEHGHTVAIKFNQYNDHARQVEHACNNLFDSHGWNRDARWFCYFGERGRRGSRRPYWFTFRNEADVTLLLLSVNLTHLYA